MHHHTLLRLDLQVDVLLKLNLHWLGVVELELIETSTQPDVVLVFFILHV